MGIIRQKQMLQLQPQLPEIGRLFKGSPKQEQTTKAGKKFLGYGKDLDHFRLSLNERLLSLPSATHVHLMAELEEKWRDLESATSGYRSIPILLPYKSIAKNFSYRNAVYDSSGRTIRSCDGSICDRKPFESRMADGRMKKLVLQGCYPCAMKDEDKECPEGCKAEGKLSMIIPALYPGLIVLTTKSVIDIKTIKANLEAYSRFDLSRIPLRLCRSLRDASYTTPEGEHKKQEKWLIHIEVDPQYGQLALQAQEAQYRAELSGASFAGALPQVEQVRQIASAKIDYEILDRLRRLAELTGFTQEKIAEIASKESRHKPVIDVHSMNASEFELLRNAVFAAWGFNQKCFNSPPEAWQAFSAVAEGLDGDTGDQAVFEAWQMIVAEKMKPVDVVDAVVVEEVLKP